MSSVSPIERNQISPIIRREQEVFKKSHAVAKSIAQIADGLIVVGEAGVAPTHFVAKNGNHDLSDASRELQDLPTDLLSLAFSFVPASSYEEYTGTEETESNRIASAYLALEKMSRDKADAFLLKCINNNSILSLDELPHQKFADFIDRKGDKIIALNLSGRLPRNLVETLKLKCSKLKSLSIDSDTFNQPVEKLTALTSLVIDSGTFNQPVEKLTALTSLVIKVGDFNQPVEKLTALTSLVINSWFFNQPVENLTALTSLVIKGGDFNQPVEKLTALTSLVIKVGDFNQPVEKLTALTSLVIDSDTFNQPVENLTALTTSLVINSWEFNQPVEKLTALTSLVIDSWEFNQPVGALTALTSLVIRAGTLTNQ